VHGQLIAGLAVSIFMHSTLTRRHAAFKVRGDPGAANVILSLLLAHAACSRQRRACQKNHFSAATATHSHRLTDGQAQ